MNQPEETSTTTAAAALAVSALSPNEVEHQLSWEKEKFLSDESQRLHREAKRLSDLSKDLMDQSKRVRDEAEESQEESKRLRTTNEFNTLCIRLRRNDLSLTSISTSTFPEGYAQPLGHALRQNTHVTSISIYFIGLLPFSKNSKLSVEEIARFVDPLVHYIRTSTVLHHLVLESMDDRYYKINEQLMGRFLEACPQTVENLDISLSGSFPVRSFQHCGQVTKLKELIMRFNTWQEFSDDEYQAMGDAFQYFPSLTSLSIEAWRIPVIDSILAGVHRGPCQLEELAVGVGYNHYEFSPEFWSGIRAIVHSPRSTQFKHLCLDGFSVYDAETMDALVLVLKRPDHASWGSSVSELTLHDCYIAQSAKRPFLDFMRTRFEQPSTELGVGSLKKVDIGFYLSKYTKLSSTFLVKMLSMGRDPGDNQAPISTEQESYATVGSQIESLTLHPLSEKFPRFLGRLAECADQIRLQELIVSSLDEQRHAHDLANCIAKIPSLHTLKADDVGTSARPILAALLENGTLRSVSIASTVAPEITSRLARAYSERNQFLEPLLLEATENSEQTEGEVARLDDGPPEPSKRHLCLTLLQTATQIPNTQSATVIRSLLRLDESIGLP